jgi:hypothetical protein
LEEVKDQHGLAPSLLQFSFQIQKEIKANPQLDAKTAQLFLLELGMWQKISRSNTQLGMGEAALLAAVAGDLRDVINFGANFTDPVNKEKLNSSILISSLTGSKMPEKPKSGELQMVRFTSAETTNYEQQIGIGYSGDGKVTCMLRDSTKNKDVQLRFAHQLNENFNLILKALEYSCELALKSSRTKPS